MKAANDALGHKSFSFIITQRQKIKYLNAKINKMTSIFFSHNHTSGE